MAQTIDAIYERGLLRPLQPLQGIEELSRVTLTVEVKAATVRSWEKFVGTLPDQDAQETLHIIEAEFEKVDLREWQ